MTTKIAIVGAGCRFPGGVRDLHSLGEALDRPEDLLGPVTRFDAEALVASGALASARGGCVEPIEDFDPAAFGLSLREAERLDPQQRLLMEVGWEALGDAGLDLTQLGGHRTGTWVGISHSDYWELLAQAGELEGPSGLGLPGNELAMASGRLAYTWGLEGPAVTVATACSSALVAVLQAVDALRAGRCDRALAGGVNAALLPAASIQLSRLGALSPTGACRPFDAKADGYLRSDGCGLVVLERLDDALAAGRRVLGVICGGAITQDGRSNGLMAPRGAQQAAAVRAALADAGLPPEALDFVETQGTGSPLGDSIEALALGEVFAGRGRPLPLSAVKSRLGHSETASGVASLLCALLAFRWRRLPGILGLTQPSPQVPWGGLGLTVSAAPLPLPEGPLRAGVSAFGISGTNAHLILESPPQPAARRRAPEGPWLLPLAAHSRPALEQRARELAEGLEQGRLDALDRLSHSLLQRAAPPTRAAVVAADPASAAAALRALDLSGSIFRDADGIGFIYTGQGASYPGMGRDLLARFPAFQDAMEDVDAALEPHLEASVLAWIEEAVDLEDTGRQQPALFALGYALTRLLDAWGITPDAVMGHSLGELTAACVAGLLSLDDAAELVAARAQAMAALPPGGQMVAVLADEDRCRQAIEGLAQVSIAAVNAPGRLVLSGSEADVQRALARLGGVSATPLRVSHAFHSPLMRPAAEALAAVAEALPHRPGRVPLVSSTDGRPYTRLQPAHWAAQLLAPVDLARGFEGVAALGVRTWVELGPHPVLCAHGRRQAAGRFLPTLRRDAPGPASLLETLGALFQEGRRLRPPGRAAAPISLPPYPFQRRRCWIDAPTATPKAPQRPAPQGLDAEALREALAQALGRPAADIPLDRPLSELGLDSVMAVELKGLLEQRSGQNLPDTLLFDHPTVLALARALGGQGAPAALASRPAREPIAVIGVGCRFPGGVEDPEAFWRSLLEGNSSSADFPPERFALDRWYDPDPATPGRSHVRRGSFLDDIDRFDARFFHISPREAQSLDPQQRLLLEVSWEALERACVAPDSLEGSATGVYIGLCADGYSEDRAPEEINPYSATGTSHSVAAGRISYTLGLRGPSVVVDTACSSSLVAAHLACEDLRSGQCDLALAGGVNLLLSSRAHVSLSKLQVLSPTGRCASFSDAADGYLRGEAAGVVVLKRLADAERDGDPVLAVIRGTAVNHDGRSQGLAAPSGPAQQDVLRAALADAGLSPAEVGFVECHGTGTALGDPIEVQALDAVHGADRDAPLLLASVKSNVGHTEGAAGIVGLIKAVCAVQAEQLPPSLNALPLNRRLPWHALGCEVLTEARPWPGPGPRVAGVSSFGFGGTNAHLLVSEAPDRGTPTAPTDAPPLHLVAGSEAALRALAGRLHAHLLAHPEHGLAEVAGSLERRRAALPWHVRLRCADRDAALEALSALASGARPLDGPKAPPPRAPAPPGLRRLALPTTPYDRERFWIGRAPQRSGHGRWSAHPLLGRAGGSARRPGERCWEPDLDAPTLRYLRDHVVHGAALVPAAAWLEAALAASQEVEPGPVRLEALRFERPLLLDRPRELQLSCESDGRFLIASRDGARWIPHARGRSRRVTEALACPRFPAERDGLQPQAAEALYRDLDAMGLSYGPAFQVAEQLFVGEAEVLALLQNPRPGDVSVAHPSLLDGAFHVLGALGGAEARVPTGVARLTLLEPLPERVWAHARLLPSGEAALALFDEDERPLLSLEGLELRPLGGEAPVRWRALRWEEQPAPPSRPGAVAAWGDADLLHALAQGGRTVTRAADAAGLAAASAPIRVCAAQDWPALLTLMKTLAPAPGERLALVTRRALALPGDAPVAPEAAAALGFARSVALERPELDLRLIDWDGGPGLLEAVAAEGPAEQVALRGGRRLVARLEEQAPEPGLGRAGERPWRLNLRPGELSSLHLAEAARRAPGPGEVELEVLAAGLNFVDVLSALGALGDIAHEVGASSWGEGLGGECVGRVLRAGPGVALTAGSVVAAITPAAMASHVLAPAALAVPVPIGLTEIQAATLPVVGATVLRALRDVAELQPGERILIHSATGGVGSLALAWARHVGAEVYATAGSEARRAQLREQGLAHVSDSRSLRFVDDVRRWTGGEGVDVVLNSLSGPLLQGGLELLRDHGRFIELGKRDVLEDASLGLRPFLRNLSFSLVDIISVSARRPAVVRRLLQDTLALAAAGVLPLPAITTAPAEEAEALFRRMAGARHVGKLVLTPAAPDAPVRLAPARARPDGAYLISGGLGALGRRLARALAEQGAGELLLLSRSGLRSEAQLADVRAMEAAGARVHTLACDVRDAEALGRALARLERPLRGVVHAAGVLGQRALRALAEAEFEAVLGPKVEGARALDALCADAELDFFLMISSTAATLGSPGQAHYAWANAWLDGLAAQRRAEGRPYASLALGPVAEEGMAATEEIRSRMLRMGIGLLRPEELSEALRGALSGDQAHRCYMGALSPDSPLAGALPMLASGEVQGGLAAELAAMDEAERVEAAGGWLRQALSEILGTPPEQLGLETPFAALGMDSLMGLELRNRVQRELGLELTATAALTHDSVQRLAAHVAALLRAEAAPEASMDPSALRAMAQLDPSLRPEWSGAPRVPAQELLLTGATGFLGAYLLRSLLDRGRRPTCLVRARDPAEGIERLQAQARRLGLPPLPEDLPVLCGDLEAPRWGLPEPTWTRLADSLDLVLHCGARVHWTLPCEALAPVNVGGLTEALRLCCEGRPKALHHVSTLGTGVAEAALAAGDLSVCNGYFLSKWVAEQRAEQARARGLPVSIYRPALVGGDSRSGEDGGTPGQFLPSLVQGCVQLGVVPAWSAGVRVVPVDYVAEAIAALCLGPGADRVDLLNPHPLPFSELIEALRARGYLLLEQPYAEWVQDLRSLPRLAPDNALAPFVSFLGAISDEDMATMLLSARAAAPAGQEQLQALGIPCPPADRGLLDRLLDRLRADGRLLPPIPCGPDEEAGYL